MNDRTEGFRKTIAAFISERHTDALKKADGKEKDPSALAARYDYDTWLADAARRVSQIHAATHVLKATHPDAKGSSLYIPPSNLPSQPEVASHVLGETFSEDIVGNAAALDVYKFLKIEHDGKRLLDWLQNEDPDLRAALAIDPDVATAHMTAFRSLIRKSEAFASHSNAKQVYWCVGQNPTDNSHYHLLQPMFPSSLLHAVHQKIQYGRFDPSMVEARKARRENRPAGRIIPEHRQLATRKLGGTKPQNISQLNSDRGGVNYLLASLPPSWNQDHPRRFLHIDSAIPRIIHFDDVKKQLDVLLSHLQSYEQRRHPEQQKRKRLEQRLGATLAAFGAATSLLFEPGWTRQPECKLPLAEKLWLDPGRAVLPVRQEEDARADDEAFLLEFGKQDWPDEIASRFAEWLNQWLRERGMPMGDVELRHWARQAIIASTSWPHPVRRDLPEKRSWASEARQ